jgi:hypothetical protein
MESGRGKLPRSQDGLQTNSADILSNLKVDLWRRKNEHMVLLPMSIIPQAYRSYVVVEVFGFEYGSWNKRKIR